MTEPTAGNEPGKTIEPPKPAAPTPVEVKLGDKTFSVAPEVAAELESAKRAAADAGTAKAATEAKLAEALQKAQPQKIEQKQEDDLDTLLFTNPKEAIKRLKDELRTEIRAETSVARAQDHFWTAFYDENPGLKDADLVVRAVMSREYETMKPLELDKARSHLAEATQKELLKLGIKREKGKGKPVGEGGNEPSGKQPKKDVGERPLTGGLSSILKERAAARREEGAKPN